MRHAAESPEDDSPIDPACLDVAALRAVEAARCATDAQGAVDAALQAIDETLGGAYVSALAVEHDLLWVVGSCGFAMLSDGVDLAEGVVGRAVTRREAQVVLDVAADPDFISLSKGVVSEVAIPLVDGGDLVGAFNLETTRALPENAAELLARVADALTPHVAAQRNVRVPDLATLARFFVYVSTLRDPTAIADVIVRAVARILSLDTCQVALVSESATPVEAVWQVPGGPAPLGIANVAALRGRVGPTVVLDVLDPAALDLPEPLASACGSLVVMPLRAAREELGLLVGLTREPLDADVVHADAAALVLAHGVASIDAALTLTRERRSALTDPLTGLFNRRGLEEVLALQLEHAQEARLPLSLAVIDCDDLKDLNDRAGHEFGDAALREIGFVLPVAAGPEAQVARLGGDEFAVVLPGAEADLSEERAEGFRTALAAGLAEAGFPLHVSVGLATYPYDGAGPTQLLRAADQALYEAKASGKDCSVSFRRLVRRSAAGTPLPRVGRPDRTGTGLGAKVLSEAFAAASAIWEEQDTEAVTERLAKSMAFVLGSVGCAISRIEGDRIVDVCQHSLRDIDLGEAGSYRIDDFPVTREVLATGVSKAISFLDEDLDRSEAFVLRELRMNCCLLIALRLQGSVWGLVEVYDMRMRRFDPDAQAAAEFLVAQAARRMEALAAPARPTRRRRRGRPQVV